MLFNGSPTLSVKFPLIQDKKKGQSQDSDSEDEVDEMPFDESKLAKKKLQVKTRSRMGISEEVFGSFNRK